jgi:hypothetical protein
MRIAIIMPVQAGLLILRTFGIRFALPLPPPLPHTLSPDNMNAIHKRWHGYCWENLAEQKMSRVPR